MGLGLRAARAAFGGGLLLALAACTYPYWIRMQVAPETATLTTAEIERATRVLSDAAAEVGLKAAPLDEATRDADSYRGEPFRIVAAWRAWYEVPPREGRVATVTMALFVKSDGSEMRVVIRDEKNAAATRATRRIREVVGERLRAAFPGRVHVTTGVDPPDVFVR